MTFEVTVEQIYEKVLQWARNELQILCSNVFFNPKFNYPRIISHLFNVQKYCEMGKYTKYL